MRTASLLPDSHPPTCTLFLKPWAQGDMCYCQGRCHKLHRHNHPPSSMVSLPGLSVESDTSQSQWGFGVGRGAGSTARLSSEACCSPALGSLSPRNCIPVKLAQFPRNQHVSFSTSPSSSSPCYFPICSPLTACPFSFFSVHRLAPACAPG